MDAIDYDLISCLQTGLPLSSRPYAQLGASLNLSEQEVIQRLHKLKQQGLIKRLGVIVNHRHLGYRANAMVVMNIPDDSVDETGRQLSQFEFVNLCYQRPRQEPQWPYNLYCMIHGKSRETVLAQLQYLLAECNLNQCAYEVLFSKRCFKQRGTFYSSPTHSTSLSNG